MLKRWQELAEPSLSSCLQSIPGVYTRAQLLQEVREEEEELPSTPRNELELTSMVPTPNPSRYMFILSFSHLNDFI